jgi:hypothetical protein
MDLRSGRGGRQRAGGASASISHAPRMVQPGMDDLPLVAPAGAELQQRGTFVLQLAEKFQAIAGGWLRRIDRLGLQPLIPFPKHLRLPLILSHRRRVLVKRGETPSKEGPGLSRWSLDSGFLRNRLIKRPGRRSATAVPLNAFETHYAWEGLIVSKCVCMDVKRLAPIP